MGMHNQNELNEIINVHCGLHVISEWLCVHQQVEFFVVVLLFSCCPHKGGQLIDDFRPLAAAAVNSKVRWPLCIIATAKMCRITWERAAVSISGYATHVFCVSTKGVSCTFFWLALHCRHLCMYIMCAKLALKLRAVWGRGENGNWAVIQIIPPCVCASANTEQGS